MAVYRNTYGRRRLNLGFRTWCIGIMISSLYLMSSCGCMTTGTHHGRHNHHVPVATTIPQQHTNHSDVHRTDIRVKTLWSRPKVVPIIHKSDKLGISRRTLRNIRIQHLQHSEYLLKSKTSHSKDVDYQGDDPYGGREFDSRDYESEDPRPLIGFGDEITEHQLEKSLLDREHTSNRPDVKCDDDSKSMDTKSKIELPSGDQSSQHINVLPIKKFSPHLSQGPAFSHCPTCYAHYLNHEKTFVDSTNNKNKIDSQSIRLEAIKQQILNKLGLKHRPIIRKKLPREIVLQSLYRAEEDNLEFFNDEKQKNPRVGKPIKTNDLNEKYEEFSSTSSGENLPTTSSTSYSTNEVQDDFYARTSEIIVFGDAGNKLNNQQLVEFSLSKYSDTGDQELKVKAATLWVKVSLVSHIKKVMVTNKNVTLWVFRVMSQDHINNRITNQEFDKHMKMATSLTINLSSLGWQKFDITPTVRDWYQNVLKPQTTSESTNHGGGSYTNYDNRDETPYSTNSSSYRYIRSKTATYYKNQNDKQKDPNRLNYESIAFGNYQINRNNETKHRDYDYEDLTDDPTSMSKKLRLLIDCSGCKNLVQIHLFNTKLDSSDAGVTSTHKKTTRQRKKPKGTRDYEIYTYDGYYNDGSGGENSTTGDNKKHKLYKQKQSENVEHRHSNHERNEKVNNNSNQYVQSDETSEQINTDDPNRPFLVIHTDPNIMKRVRRRALDCSGALKGQCCKQRFYVNFTDLGWSDWILAPQGYYANYCMGSCNSVHRTPDTFLNYYTHVIYEYQKYGDLKGLQPCCAPVKFSSTSLIYFGPDSNIIKRDLPKMTVDECGCP